MGPVHDFSRVRLAGSSGTPGVPEAAPAKPKTAFTGTSHGPERPLFRSPSGLPRVPQVVNHMRGLSFSGAVCVGRQFFLGHGVAW